MLPLCKSGEVARCFHDMLIEQISKTLRFVKTNEKAWGFGMKFISEFLKSQWFVISLASIIIIIFLAFFSFGEISVSGKIEEGKANIDFFVRN